MLCKQGKQLNEPLATSGNHACILFHGTEEWLQHVMRLIDEAQALGERVLLLLPEQQYDSVDEAISRLAFTDSSVEIGIIEDLFSSWAEIDSELCEVRLRQVLKQSLQSGFSGLRIVMDMSWLTSYHLSVERIETCIQRIDTMVGTGPLSVYAGLDRQIFSSRRLLNILPLYPMVWVNGALTTNIYHENSLGEEGQRTKHEALLEYVLAHFEQNAAKLARSELEAALRLLKQIIDSMGDGVIVADCDGGMLFFNRTGSQIIGYEYTDVPLEQRVRTFGNYLPDKKTPFPVDQLPITRAIRGESVDQVEIYIRNERRPEGVWVSATGRPLRDSEGKLLGGVVVFRDVTQKKLDEEARLELEARMLQTQKLESLGLLAGGIAHDFNNLLMGILGHAGMALEFASPENVERLTHIQKTALHLSELTNQLLDFAGKGSYVNRAVDMETLVCELCGMIRPILSKKARLELDFSDSSLLVMADPSQIRQVIMNLVTNASDALGDSPGDITIRTCRRVVSEQELRRSFLREGLTPGEYVSVSVRDTGSGISPEQLQRIFDPFFTTKAAGRGLGLAAVLGLVRRHGGGLLVESVVGKGTTFEVLLPPSEEQPSVDATPGGILTGAASGSVLVIDDEEVVRSVAKQILEFAGFDVEVACSGADGLELFAAQPKKFDAILLDVSMPDIDGRELCTRLRSHDPRARIVLSSGYSENEMLGDATLEGLAGFLQKPYSPEKLIGLLQQILPSS